MKREFLAKAGAFAVAGALLLPTTGAYAETPTSSAKTTAETATVTPLENVQRPFDTDKVFMEEVDKNGKVIKTYSKDEVRQMQQNNSNKALQGVASYSVYSFGYTSFSSNRWIKNGNSFYKPNTVWVDAKGRTSGLAVSVHNYSEYMGETRIWGAFDGGMQIPIGHHLAGYEDYYQLKFKNYDGGTIYLNEGQVYYG